MGELRKMYITFGHMLEVGIHRLEEAKIADAKRDAETLLLYLEKADRTFLYVHRNDATDEYRADAYFGLIDRRAAGEPLQYILGSQEFMGLNFAVNPSVLIPRQDTETLVELALKRVGEKKRSLSILDMCCGSGAIAVSMAHFLPKAKITACDISPEALEVARGNAARNGLNGRIEFRESDLFFMTKRKKTVRIKDSFDMILSNPPYIPTQDIDTLQTEVRDHEPIKALDGGSDGLDFYRRIAEDAFGSLKKDGLMFLEIGCDQAEAVTSLLSGAGYYSEIEVHKDLTGLDRVISCRRQR